MRPFIDRSRYQPDIAWPPATWQCRALLERDRATIIPKLKSQLPRLADAITTRRVLSFGLTFSSREAATRSPTCGDDVSHCDGVQTGRALRKKLVTSRSFHALCAYGKVLYASSSAPVDSMKPRPRHDNETSRTAWLGECCGARSWPSASSRRRRNASEKRSQCCEHDVVGVRLTPPQRCTRQVEVRRDEILVVRHLLHFIADADLIAHPQA